MEAYYESDASLESLRNKIIGIIGYGNQGRAQSLNLRDSGLKVIVGGLRDETAQQAEADGFEVLPISTAVERADVLALLIPDEVQREVYNEVIGKKLRPGQTLDFAHGYNIHFGLIVPPQDVDVIMVAPRMIGAVLRAFYEKGGGAPAFVGIHQDATGHAWDTTLSFARGIGATRVGVLKTTFAQETELDLFHEQGLWPLLVRTFLSAFDVLVEKGFPPEMVALEMYGSEEAAEIFHEMAHVGFFNQMKLHSHTSQYGVMSRAHQVPFQPEIKDFMERAMGGIRDGRFAQEWRKEQEAGYPVFGKLMAEAESHPLNEAESRMRDLLKY